MQITSFEKGIFNYEDDGSNDDPWGNMLFYIMCWLELKRLNTFTGVKKQANSKNNNFQLLRIVSIASCIITAYAEQIRTEEYELVDLNIDWSSSKETSWLCESF